MSPVPPPLPRQITAPLPVVITGTALWMLAAIVTASSSSAFGDLWITCVTGVGVGAFGCSVFILQRRAAARGDRGAQQGLL
ncbi:DUF2530 domain-containing protein [Tsukamurella sp. 8F]|uniref:DUF2530 domain-containing protein n=1 Tax=unclassified Tsukamurella TaxID=2633480 RepID=UPI0023BA3D30|nr:MULTISPECIES: DUF2530 domain-containing protein [unclassified Tsukamurella]MDF0529824.1 DUF2530 domain-containing protein [Tsukamurella sp. 8J]MDF0587016.1 DUF2530 domain-containing protein [Tsukamurella sp. 8F]